MKNADKVMPYWYTVNVSAEWGDAETGPQGDNWDDYFPGESAPDALCAAISAYEEDPAACVMSIRPATMREIHDYLTYMLEPEEEELPFD